MNIDHSKKQFSNEAACRRLFESILWGNGRFCPHCKCEKPHHLRGASVRAGLYVCGDCVGKIV